ncbi:MAG: ABC transporter [Acidobacteria bacterium]|nr:MAG: ABC transporter [Acidobacteriota bacterium]PYQ83395.1 MAG: ABC transporter [Acidobacteriota bacterium]PYQ86007.1 MAG: ABC transporter [Acidobacteriota bacterium]PYR04520.1 MAG: ABC transporter [Acidobacteriota bacterium]
MPRAAAVELDQLSKSFRVRRARSTGVAARLRDLFSGETQTVCAVDKLSFSIAPGERVAFIGPNGAGKSTTLKMLAGILQPDAGDVRVLGLVPSRQRRQLAFQIGTVFGQRSQLWYQLPPRDTFELLGRVYEVDAPEHRRRIDALSSVFDLGTLVNTPVRHLSLGERMRCEIVASLLHSPRMLFLDEPTIGLDVSAKATIRELLWTQSEQERVTLLLTSHDTGDMERVCTRAIVINHGRLLWDGPIAALRRSYLKAKRVTLWSEAEHLELTLPGVRVLSSGAYRTELEIALEITPLGQVVDAALRQTAIRDMAIEDAPLDEVIRALYATAATGSVPS